MENRVSKKEKEKEKEENTEVSGWNEVVKRLVVGCGNSLKLLSNRELHNDANRGITEVGFKIALVSNFACMLKTYDEFRELELESEREVTGGRIDLVLTNQISKSILVIELKYVRLPFLEKLYNEKYTSVDFKREIKRWGEEDSRIKGLTSDELLKERVAQSFVVKGYTVSVEDLYKEALNQVKKYCASLRSDYGIRKAVGSDFSIYRLVILGIGRNIYHSRIIKH